MKKIIAAVIAISLSATAVHAGGTNDEVVVVQPVVANQTATNNFNTTALLGLAGLALLLVALAPSSSGTQ